MAPFIGGRSRAPVLLAAAVGWAAGCGGGAMPAAAPTHGAATGGPTVGDRAVAPHEGAEVQAAAAALPAGVEPFAPTAFVTFLGIAHGANEAELGGLLPETHESLGERTPMDIMGSRGFKYDGHFAVSWQTSSGRIDYITVKSDAAVRYLEAHARRDDKLQVLWGISPGGAVGVLGQPTDVVDRPHAQTYRYEFEAPGGRAGAVSLEFSKLSSPLRCSAVSVHWLY